MSKLQLADARADDWLAWIYPIGLLVMICGPILFAYQCLMWLIDGHWTHLPVERFTGHATVSWAGAQKIIDYLLSMEVAFALFAAPLALLLLVTHVADHIGAKARVERIARKL